MNDALRARRLETGGDVIDDDLRVGETESTLRAELVREIVAAEALHRDVRDAARRRSDVEHADDVGTVDARGRVGLAEKALQVHRVVLRARAEELHRRAATNG